MPRDQGLRAPRTDDSSDSSRALGSGRSQKEDGAETNLQPQPIALRGRIAAEPPADRVVMRDGRMPPTPSLTMPPWPTVAPRSLCKQEVGYELRPLRGPRSRSLTLRAESDRLHSSNRIRPNQVALLPPAQPNVLSVEADCG